MVGGCLVKLAITLIDLVDETLDVFQKGKSSKAEPVHIRSMSVFNNEHAFVVDHVEQHFGRDNLLFEGMPAITQDHICPADLVFKLLPELFVSLIPDKNFTASVFPFFRFRIHVNANNSGLWSQKLPPLKKRASPPSTPISTNVIFFPR